MKPFFIYILRCADGSYYVGQTDEFEKRMIEHSTGLVAYTRHRGPLEVVLVEELPTRDEAINRERQLKRWTHAKKTALINANWKRLKGLAISVHKPWH